MSALTMLEQAIHSRSPIRFRYLREGKTPELRVGNPHAVYIKRLKSGEEKTYVDLWQTAGASDTAYEQPLPSWRKCFLDGIEDVELLPDDCPFGVCPTYNPTFYEYPICKI